MNEIQIANLCQSSIGAMLLRNIDDLATERITRDDDQTFCKGVSRELSKLMKGHTFDIKVVKVDPKVRPFIMSIYPNMDELKTFGQTVKELFNPAGTGKEFNKAWGGDCVQQWGNITNWVIEVDANLFSKNSNIAIYDGREFTALLLHELGHTCQYHIEILRARIMTRKFQSSIMNRAIISSSKLTPVLMLPMLVSGLVFTVPVRARGTISSIEEIRADLAIPKDYIPDFISYVDRAVLANPVIRKDVIKTTEELDNDYDVSVAFSANTIELMRNRRDLLATSVSSQHRLTSSPYLKELMRTVMYSVNGKDLNTGKFNPVKEKCINTDLEEGVCNAKKVTEGLLSKKRKVSDRELSVLKIETQNITTHEDKLYVLHTIYDYLEAISTIYDTNTKGGQEAYDNDKRVKFLKRLEEEVTLLQLPEKQYGLFIKYPAGYEG